VNREWLETNGIGGFASSTGTSMNTRRYHGLLVAATQPPVGRMVLLSKIEETAVVNGRRFELSCNQYPGVIHPDGHLRLKEFRCDPFPAFVYDLDGAELEKNVFMVHGENTTVIEYEWKGEGECVLEVRPLLAFRDYHSTTRENAAISSTLELEPGCVTVSPYQGCPDLSLAHTAAEVEAEGHWYRNFEYTIEQERGLDYREDLFNPMTLKFVMSRGSRAAVIASTRKRNAADAEGLRLAELERRNSIGAGRDPFERTLFMAADQFIVRRGEGSTVIAGYHWFSDWGRDTMIALPGLTLATGRYHEARGMLLAFADSVDRGMLPNRFPDAGETPEYNTVDATLWFFEAVRAFAAHTGDHEFVRARLYPVLADIIGWHEQGTRYGIRLDADGLLLAGEPGVQLTWMDAKVGDWVVTPRYGKPVEIQALWYNALRVMEELSGEAKYREMADRARDSFRQLFWNGAAGCLYDVVDGDRRDASIRPNQIFTVSLYHSMLDGEKAKAVVAAVERDLLTPYGLRSLAPSGPQYRGRYEGDPFSRDSAYHQGTVWPWLVGPFITAYLKVNGRSAKSRKQADKWLSELRRFMLDEGGGQIPEVFDGDAPHRAGGCIAQAWSVAELLRVCVEELPTARPARRIAAVAN
jgi:predicted glycogen debranching enzyme